MEDRVYVKNTFALMQLINATNLLRKFQGNLFKDDTAESVADPSYGVKKIPKTNERLEPMSNLRRFVLANTYFPGPSPAKYLRHDRA